MPTNPNKAFTERDKPFWVNDDLPISEAQKTILRSVMQSKDIPWSSLCVVALGYNKLFPGLNRGEARTCLLKAYTWDNLKMGDMI